MAASDLFGLRGVIFGGGGMRVRFRVGVGFRVGGLVVAAVAVLVVAAEVGDVEDEKCCEIGFQRIYSRFCFQRICVYVLFC